MSPFGKTSDRVFQLLNFRNTTGLDTTGQAAAGAATGPAVAGKGRGKGRGRGSDAAPQPRVPGPDVVDWIVFCCNYMTCDKNGLLLASYDMFDYADGGTLLLADVKQLLSDSYGITGHNKELVESIAAKSLAVASK